MRVALGRVDGVASVDVTLKRGVAHITLRDGNTVTLAQVRRIVKDAGYTSRDAAVTAAGRIVSKEGGYQFSVEGTNELFRLEADPGQAGMRRDAWPPQNGLVELSGTVSPPDSGTKTPATLRVRTIAVRH